MDEGSWKLEFLGAERPLRQNKVLATARKLVRPSEILHTGELGDHRQEEGECEPLLEVGEGEAEEEIDKQSHQRGLMPGGSSDGGLGQEMAAVDEDLGGDDGAEGDRDEGEEGRRPATLPSPIRVTRAEREEHELTHTPFRPWCPHCVRGRGKNAPT